MPVPFTPGFPSDWPVRPGNLLQLDYLARTRNIINIWLPESVRSPNGHLLFIPNEEADYRFRRLCPETWEHTFEKPGIISFAATTRHIDDGLDLQLSLTNLSTEPYLDVTAGVCVQLIAAPDFVDTQLQRTHFVNNSQLQQFELPTTEPNSPIVFYSTSQATENFIAVASLDARFTIAQWWQGTTQPGGNAHPSLACIHTNPTFALIDPGQTVSRRGRLYLMPGSPSDAYQRYLADYQPPS